MQLWLLLWFPKIERKKEQMNTHTSTNWRFTREEIETASPSRRHQMSVEEERRMRYKGCQFIYLVGMAVRLPQIAIASACVFFHRFYMRESFKKHPFHDVAAACVFLAAKVEEQGRKLNALVLACAQKAAKNDNLKIDENTKEYWRWRDTITYYEEVIIATLCFDLTVDHPYERMMFIGKFYIRLPDGIEMKELIEVAWAFASDGCRYTWCLQYSSDEIAFAALYAAIIYKEDSFKARAQIPTDKDGNAYEYLQLDVFSDAMRFFEHFSVDASVVFEIIEWLASSYREEWEGKVVASK